MSILTSNLFTHGDSVTVDKLENCARGRPSEVQSHFTLNQSGEHIRRVQEALKSVQESNPGLGIPGFSVNGVYVKEIAKAIRVYKTKRDIKNFANKIDDIVGINTIRSLDRENKSGPPKVNPSPTPRPDKPNDVPRADGNALRIIRRVFSKTDASKSEGDPRESESKELVDTVRELIFDTLFPE